MVPTNRSIVKLLAWNSCIALIIVICHTDSILFAEARRRGGSGKTKFYRSKYSQEGRWRNMLPGHVLRSHNARNKNFINRDRKIGDFLVPRARPTMDARTERIRQAILTLPELSKLLDPLRHASNLDDILAPVDNLHLSGTVRRRRLYCRVGMGFHLEIRQDGRVVGRHKPTRDGILEIFSVKTGVVGVRGVSNERYLCMDRRGKLYSSNSFTHECEFRERIEENNFNTYASNTYSNHEKQTGYYMSLTKKGKSKKSKNVSGRQQKAHWLPRSVND